MDDLQLTGAKEHSLGWLRLPALCTTNYAYKFNADRGGHHWYQLIQISLKIKTHLLLCGTLEKQKSALKSINLMCKRKLRK